jgi:L-lactate dehydrogenase complex protein LldG
MNRHDFLQTVRQAARQGQAYRVAAREIPAGTGYVGAAGDLCEHFVAEVNLVGGQAVLVENQAAARDVLQGLLARYSVRSALVWRHAVLERLGLHALLAEANVAMHDHAALAALSPAEQRSAALAAELGITSVDLAIAETGTLLMCSAPGHERMASLVPPAHVAIVEASQIVPDLLDAFAELEKRGVDNLPSNITLITGPSKTGDIELQLTTGVHGPGHWHVVVIR